MADNDRSAPVWLVEPGIGEDRAILVAHDTILTARLCWRETWRAGAVAEARLAHRIAGTRRGAVRLPDDTIAHVEGIPRGLSEGAPIIVQITREAIAEQGRTKFAQCRAAPTQSPRPAPTLAESLVATGHSVRLVSVADRGFDRAGWIDLIDDARRGAVDFVGGALTISPTPAMTLIDVDGPPPAQRLALAAAPAIAAAIGRFDIAGSIGIDFPTLTDRAERLAVDAALGQALSDPTLAGWRGERTAINGFGFAQLVSRLERPSLVARLARHPARSAAYALLRQAERVTEPGALLLTAHPAVLGMIDASLEAELARRSGRLVRRHAEPALATGGGFAQAIAS